jgi:hypothetical protein
MAALGFGTAGAATASAAGTTLYVSTTGSDTNPCTKAAPCATIQHAVDLATPGATVSVESGHYYQTVNITKPLSLVGDGAKSTIIDGSNIDTALLGYYGVAPCRTTPARAVAST